MKKLVLKLLSFVFSAAILISLANAETFRVRKNHVIQLSSSEEIISAQLGINESLTIFYPEEKVYIQGIAIEVKIPQLAISWRDAMEWSLYDALTPMPKSETIDYSGTSIQSGLLPARVSWSIVIPLTENNTIKNSPYISKLDLIPQSNSKCLMFRLNQVMKGTPEEFENLRFEVSVRPILTNLGKLQIELNSPDGTDVLPKCSLFVDEVPFELQKNGNYLESGIHTFSLVSDFFRNEVRTVQIEQAKTTSLSINLHSIEPFVTIAAPNSTEIYFDGIKLEPEEKTFIIDEGDHTVKFSLGNYEIEKKFTARKGQSYNISLNIQAVVTEE